MSDKPPRAKSEGLLALLRAGRLYRHREVAWGYPTQMGRSVERLVKQFTDAVPAPPTVVDLDELDRRIRELIDGRRPLTELAPRLQRQAPWVFFLGGGRKRPLGERPDAVAALTQLLKARTRAQDAIVFLHCFLREYPDSWVTFRDLRVLGALLLKLDSVRVRTWRERALRCHYFDEDGPRLLANQALDHPAKVEDAMADAQLVGELEAGQFALRTFELMMMIVGLELTRTNGGGWRLKGLLDYAAKGGRLRYPAHGARLADTLLGPFAEKDPLPSDQDAITEFVLHHFGHPEINRTNWQGVSQAARDVMLQWQIGATLEDFFHIVDKTAPAASADSRRWRFRRHFWTACHEQRILRSAWMALGREGVDIVKAKDKQGLIRYSVLDRGLPHDCLLLMKIGNMTFAEWSHMGSLRVWMAESKFAPILYQPRYDKGLITRGRHDHDFYHHGAELGTWQRQVADFIFQRTGKQLPRELQVPKRVGRWP